MASKLEVAVTSEWKQIPEQFPRLTKALKAVWLNETSWWLACNQLPAVSCITRCWLSKIPPDASENLCCVQIPQHLPVIKQLNNVLLALLSCQAHPSFLSSAITEAVKQKPILWDSQNDEYKLAWKKVPAWVKISLELGCTRCRECTV